MKLLFLIVVLSIVITTNAYGPQVLSAEYQVNQISVVSAKLTMGLVNVTFDEDIFQPKSIHCAPSVGAGRGCVEYPSCDVTACDYTHANPLGCGMLPVECNVTCPLKDYVCDTETFHWIDILPGIENTQHFIAPTEGFVEYRFYNDKPCNGFKVVLLSEDGEPVVLTSFQEPLIEKDAYVEFPNRGSYDWHASQEISFCPYDQDWGYYQVGTLFLTVYNTMGDWGASLYIVSEEITQTLDTPAPEVVSEFHTPLQDGVPIDVMFGDGETDHYYTYTFTGGCQLLTLRAQVPAQSDVDICISQDPNNQFPYYTGDWVFARDGEDYGTFAACAEENESKTLYISVRQISSSTIYRLFITSKSPRYLTRLNEGYQNAKAFELYGAASINTRTQHINCPDYRWACYGFWGVFPMNNPNVLFPQPYVFLVQPPPEITGQSFRDAIPPQPAGNRTFMATALLYWAVSEYTGAPVPVSDFYNSTMVFLGQIVNKDFEPVIGSYKLTKAAPTCQYDQFAVIKANLTQYLDKLQDTNNTHIFDVIQTRLNMDLLTQFNAWSSCQQLANDLAGLETQTIEYISSNCEYLPNTPEWLNDPCCNSFLKWSLCCAPSPRKVSHIVYTENENLDLINGMCKNPSCATDISTSYGHIFPNLDNCNADARQIFDDLADLVLSIRNCSVFLFSTPTFCTDVSECPIEGSYCDLQTHSCVPPVAWVERQYLLCAVQSVHGLVRATLRTHFNLPINASEDQTIDAFFNTFSVVDCVRRHGSDIDIDHRGHYYLHSYPANCEAEFPDICVPHSCLDYFCDVSPSACDLVCARSWAWAPAPDTCEDDHICNWHDCTGLSPDQCQTECDLGPETYCGVELNPEYSPEVPGSNVATCGAPENGVVCLDPYAQIHVVGTVEECTEDFGVCTVSCPSCDSVDYPFGACVYSGVTEANCNVTYAGGVWDATSSSCVVATNSPNTCTGGNYQSCRALTRDECATCSESTGCGLSALLQCAWNPAAECLDRQSCVNGGRCSDNDYFPADGACVVEGSYDLTIAKQEFCVPPLRFVPQGCVDSTLNTMELCVAGGGQWHVPALTNVACTAPKGCYDFANVQRLQVSLSRQFSRKDYGNCTLCGWDWESYFSWEQGDWIAGKVMTPTVTTKVFESKRVWATSLYYPYVALTMNEVLNSATVTAYQAEAICRFNKLEKTLTNLACDCTESGQAHGACYETSPTSLDSLGRICAAATEPTVLTTSDATLYFPPDAVLTGCAEVLLYDISAQTFETSQPVRLASYFASFDTIPTNAIKNEKGGIIGAILGEGIFTQTDAIVHNVRICIKIPKENRRNDFTHFDFAFADSDFSYLTPRELTATEENDRLCTTTDLPAGSAHFIPIKRVADWRNVQTAYFSQTAVNLLLTLGVFYILIAAFAFVQIILLVVFVIKGKINPLQIANVITISIFVFALIRCVYFFLVPTGQLSVAGSIAEYILIVFPTFPYFTAFSCVPVVWALLTDGTLRKEGNAQRILRMVGIVNSVLYILFIIIIVVFNETKQIITADCLGNSIQTAQLSTSQVAISIVYSVVIATVSLVIAVSFLYFGRKVAMMSQTEHVIRRTYKMAVVSSVGFALNCLFILIITGAQLNNVGFSFAGLIISEVIPSVFMLTSFGSFEALVKLAKKEISRTRSATDSTSDLTSRGSRGKGMSTTASTDNSSYSSSDSTI